MIISKIETKPTINSAMVTILDRKPSYSPAIGDKFNFDSTDRTSQNFETCIFTTVITIIWIMIMDHIIAID